jgi:hypothetical protein
MPETSFRFATCILYSCATFLSAHSIVGRIARAESVAGDIRWGGVLDESHQYHRQAALLGTADPHCVAPSTGWYGYGFPVRSFRWGWFGADRYYPRVVWHKGYYGDGRRWAYRCGY